MGVAHGIEAVRREEQQRVRSLHSREDGGQLFLQRGCRRAGEEVKDHLGVRIGLEDGAVALHLPPECLRVGEVAVVSDGDGAAGGGRRDGLGISQIGTPRRRVADVADGAVPGQAAQALGAEHIGDPSHPLLDMEAHAVGSCDPRGFLPPVLEGIETQIGHVRGLGMVPDPEQPVAIPTRPVNSATIAQFCGIRRSTQEPYYFSMEFPICFKNFNDRFF